MTAKDYLCQIERIELNIRQIEERIVELREVAASAGSPGFEASTGSGRSSRVETAVIKLRTLEDKLILKKSKLIAMRGRFQKQILQLDDIRYVKILMMRYVNGMKLTDISDEIGYGYDYTCTLHGQALDAFAKTHGF